MPPKILLSIRDWDCKTDLERIYMSASVSPEAIITWTKMNWSMSIKLNTYVDDPGHSCECMSVTVW